MIRFVSFISRITRMNTHVRERAIFVQTNPAFLSRLEDMIEELIAIRDALDGDADFEPEIDEDDADFEPTLGAPERPSWDTHEWARGSREDGEAEITTPTLAPALSQDRPHPDGYKTPDDAEDGWDREDDTADEEPALGATNAFDQNAAWMGCGPDHEEETEGHE